MKKNFFLLSIAALAVMAGCTKQAEPDPYDGREAKLTSFSFTASNNPAVLLVDCEGEIKGNAVSVTVPYGTKLNQMVATFTVGDKESIVTVASVPQVSGVTANDFTAPVDYVVSLGEKKNAKYTVTCVFAPEAQWASAGRTDIDAAYLSMVINPVSDSPEFFALENVASSRGPVKVYSDISKEPVVASPEGFTCQYLAAGISAEGKHVIFTNDYQSTSSARKGMVLTSADGKTYNRESVVIDYSNSYYGPKIGFFGKNIFAISCNNAAVAPLAKRDANMTRFDGSVWTTGTKLCTYEGATGYYFPVLSATSEAIYAFVYVVGKGAYILKWDGAGWVEHFALPSDSKYTFQAYVAQGFVANEDGTFYLALGNNADPYIVNVVKINPAAESEAAKFVVLGSDAEVGGSIAARYARVAVSPLGKVYFLYRTGVDHSYSLYVTSHDEEKFEWNTATCLVANKDLDNFDIAFNAAGKGFVCCSVAAVKNEAKEIVDPAHIEVYALK